MPPKKTAPQKVETSDITYSQEELLKMIQDCLREHGSESNIPFGHDYWLWVGWYRYMRNP